MGLSTIATMGLGLLATALPSIMAADSLATDTSAHYRLKARVLAKMENTPEVDGWALEVQRLGITTRYPVDYMWGVLWNSTFSPGRGGDIFYTQTTDNNTYVRTDAPNNSGEVTPFGFSITEQYDLNSNSMIAVRSILSESATDVTTADDGVPFLEKPDFDGMFVACKEAYEEWALVYWLDFGKHGTDLIWDQENRSCTETQLVAECTSEDPEHDGLGDTDCVADIADALAMP